VRRVPARILELPVVSALRVQRPRRPVRPEDGTLPRLPRLERRIQLRPLSGHLLRRSSTGSGHPLSFVSLSGHHRVGTLVRVDLLTRRAFAGRHLRVSGRLRWSALRRLRRQLLRQSGGDGRKLPSMPVRQQHRSVETRQLRRTHRRVPAVSLQHGRIRLRCVSERLLRRRHHPAVHVMRV